jgi:hypothetical protein
MTETRQIVLPQPSQLVSRDLRQLAAGLDPNEARFLVDYYYQTQEDRKSANNQVRAAVERNEPCDYVRWLASLEESLESQIRSALDIWTKNQPVSAWARSQLGIGPVIAAGLAAHINIQRTPSPSALARFAGLDPTIEWHGAKGSRELVRAAQEAETAEEKDAGVVAWLARATHRHVGDLWEAQGARAATREEAQAAIAREAGCDPSEVQFLFDDRPLHADNAISHACEELGISVHEVYAQLYQGYRVDLEALVKYLSRRPWNARLKTLLWKLGESFVKVSGNEEAFYGQLYRQFKAEEVRKNEEGLFAEQAAGILQKKRIGTDTVARGQYEKGRLPDAHVHARAKRRAVKIFLSHYWQVAYELHYRRPAPQHWIFAHGGHIDFIPPPNYVPLS